MKKLITVVAVLFFALGLNANTLKEEIYNSNPAQFNKLTKELQDLHNVQTEKQQKVLMEQNLNKAIKAVFSNKEIVNNYKYAVVKNGQIIKLSTSDDEDGLLFWHEHSSNVQDAPEAYTCRIENPSWENINYDTACGVIKIQLQANSPYANMNLVAPGVRLYLDTTELESALNNADPDVPGQTFDGLLPQYIYSTSLYNYPGYQTSFNNNEVITDSLLFAGFVDGTYLYKPLGLYYKLKSTAIGNTYYRPTENYAQIDGSSVNIVTLKSGNYIKLIETGYFDQEYNGYTILRWFKIRVENYYLGDVGIQNNTLNRGAKIGFNNREITITLEDSINPTDNVYELYDIGGKLIERRKLFSHETKISMPQVSNGIYVVRVQGKNLSASKKISFVK